VFSPPEVVPDAARSAPQRREPNLVCSKACTAKVTLTDAGTVSITGSRMRLSGLGAFSLT
jgi:hypothetical protein